MKKPDLCPSTAGAFYYAIEQETDRGHIPQSVSENILDPVLRQKKLPAPSRFYEEKLLLRQTLSQEKNHLKSFSVGNHHSLRYRIRRIVMMLIDIVANDEE